MGNKARKTHCSHKELQCNNCDTLKFAERKKNYLNT
ncbi:hypothetical protein KSS87_010797 [Heliosperma pusillum]|nr:hypothetical protein KSS87_010797 [Heliosperma pusillum]